MEEIKNDVISLFITFFDNIKDEYGLSDNQKEILKEEIKSDIKEIVHGN